jgi:hypothetical protein
MAHNSWQRVDSRRTGSSQGSSSCQAVVAAEPMENVVTGVLAAGPDYGMRTPFGAAAPDGHRPLPLARENCNCLG